MELIDTHCHLYVEPLDRGVPAVLDRARAAGVGAVIVPAYDVESWPAVAELARRDGIHAALGLHPWVADQPLDLDALEEALHECHAVAVGEIGLDFKIPEFDPARQVEVLKAQLRLARKLELPVILHCRGAFEELFAVLSENGPGLRGVAHAFSRGVDLARRFVEMGLMLGLAGSITRPRAKRSRRSAEEVPLEAVVLETDAPSIGMEDVPPESVEPRHVLDVAHALAEIRHEPLDHIARVTTANAKRLFQLP
jgi:TatD DNase family protein